MSVNWIMLGLVGWALGLAFVRTLMRMAGAQEGAAVHELSAYREGVRRSFPWAAVNWLNFYIGAGLSGFICLIVSLALLGWAG